MKTECGKLLICPTPLGNLGDMPPRALEALRNADLVCCEDTRVTGKLLAALGVEGKRLERMDEEVLATRAQTVLERAQAGEAVVYCSDAGMPGVSDPGQRLIALAREMDVAVEVLPGPTAVTTAYVASGFTCPRFYFGGFFPRKAGERRQAAEFSKKLDAVSLYYESPHRLVACLESLAETMPTRLVAVCRELSKLHEEIVCGTAADLAAQFLAREAEPGGIKGEIVVVIDAASEQEEAADEARQIQQASARAQELLGQANLSKKDIAAALQDEFGLTRNAAYELVYGA